MGFYKNANSNIQEYKPGDDIEIGATGKYVEIKYKDINIQTVDTKPSYHFTCNINNLTSEDPDFLEHISAADLFNKIESEKITQEYDHVTDIVTTYFKAVPILERYSDYKMAATRIRHACGDCAFHGMCDKAPVCTIKPLRFTAGLKLKDLEGVYFFEKGEVTTERVSVEHKTYTRDTYDSFSGWDAPRCYYY